MSKRLQQVLVNILDNVKNHSEEGTNILLDVVQTSQNIIITIIDEGEGIPDQDLPYIFDRLYRIENHAQDKVMEWFGFGNYKRNC